MSLNHQIAKNILLPIGDLLTGNKVKHFFEFLYKSQWWSKEDITNYQNNKLKCLIKHSVESVPYYRNLFKELHLSINDIQTKEDLKKIPVLTKAEIKSQGTNNFLSESYPRRNTLNVSSSGSTGEPLFYKTTKGAYSLNIAANLRGWTWMGFQLGDKYVKLSQNNRKSYIKKTQDWLSNNLYLETNPMIESNFIAILNKIEKYQPKVIRCYPDPLLFLARQRKKSSNYKFQPMAITLGYSRI